MTHSVFRSVFFGAALAMLIAGCEKQDQWASVSNREPPQSVTAAEAIPQLPPQDPSLPDATTALAADDAVDKAKAEDDNAALRQASAPQSEMTKEEESKAMPRPSQANDHSTPALDKDTER